MTDSYKYISMRMFCVLMGVGRCRGDQLLSKAKRGLSRNKFLSYRGAPLPMPVYPKSSSQWQFDCLEVKQYLDLIEHTGIKKGAPNATKLLPFDAKVFIPLSVYKMRDFILKELDNNNPYDDFTCLSCPSERREEDSYTEFEIDLVDLAYSHTEGDRDMAYRIGQEIYEYLKRIEPEIDNWYESKR